MNEAKFMNLKERAEGFQFTSMNYTDYSEVSGFEIISEDDGLILMYGYNQDKKTYEYHFACNTAEELLGKIDKDKRNAQISFVPEEWVERFKQFGFKVYAVFNDYVNPDINNIEVVSAPEFLTEEDCEAAARVTVACRGQSRGFHGETAEFMKAWIKGEEHAISDCGAKGCAVFLHREDGKIVGVVCTATYAYGSPKGPIAWIREIAVHPDYQRRGIAKKLILQALNFGKANGAVRAFLMADECNEHAIHLYGKLGFTANKDEKQIDMVLL
jgi:ribosomal protein S18 acetylase RimI-like enzyme